MDTKRDVQVAFYLTESDANFFEDVAQGCGFKSRSALFTAIAENLAIGGMSGVVFAKVGWQFSKLMAKNKVQKGFYFGVRPLPPLIGDVEKADEAGLVPFLQGLTREAKAKV